MVGFEPTTPGPPDRYAKPLRHIPRSTIYRNRRDWVNHFQNYEKTLLTDRKNRSNICSALNERSAEMNERIENRMIQKAERLERIAQLFNWFYE